MLRWANWTCHSSTSIGPPFTYVGVCVVCLGIGIIFFLMIVFSFSLVSSVLVLPLFGKSLFLLQVIYMQLYLQLLAGGGLQTEIVFGNLWWWFVGQSSNWVR